MCATIGYAESSPCSDRTWLEVGGNTLVVRGPDYSGEC
jgi:hypothetical protein